MFTLPVNCCVLVVSLPNLLLPLENTTELDITFTVSTSTSISLATILLTSMSIPLCNVNAKLAVSMSVGLFCISV